MIEPSKILSSKLIITSIKTETAAVAVDLLYYLVSIYLWLQNDHKLAPEAFDWHLNWPIMSFRAMSTTYNSQWESVLTECLRMNVQNVSFVNLFGSFAW